MVNAKLSVLVSVVIVVGNLYALWASTQAQRDVEALGARMGQLGVLRDSVATRLAPQRGFPVQRYASMVASHQELVAAETRLHHNVSSAVTLLLRDLQSRSRHLHTRLSMIDTQVKAPPPALPPIVLPSAPPPPVSVPGPPVKKQKKLADWLPEFPPAQEASVGGKMRLYIDLENGFTEQLLNLLEREKQQQARFREDLHEWLGEYVSTRLDLLQGPGSLGCRGRASVSVKVGKECGFGCQLHHTNHCFKKAISEGALLSHIANSAWRYADAPTAPCRLAGGSSSGWDCFFEPLSPCPEPHPEPIIRCPITETAGYHLEYYVPPNLKRVAAHFHRDPPVWFAGQTEAWLMRPSAAHFSEHLNAALASVPAQRPLISVHIRRTDKIGTEASKHGFKEYMERAHAFLLRDFPAAGPSLPHSLYVLSDDSGIASEIDAYYASSPHPRPHVAYSRDSIASGAVNTRSSGSSLRLLLQDLIIAQQSDYFVGTFSSQISRVVYELMQVTHVDPYDQVASLDDGWYYG